VNFLFSKEYNRFLYTKNKDVRSEIRNLEISQKEEEILRMVRKLLQQNGF